MARVEVGKLGKMARAEAGDSSSAHRPAANGAVTRSTGRDGSQGLECVLCLEGTGAVGTAGDLTRFASRRMGLVQDHRWSEGKHLVSDYRVVAKTEGSPNLLIAWLGKKGTRKYLENTADKSKNWLDMGSKEVTEVIFTSSVGERAKGHSHTRQHKELPDQNSRIWKFSSFSVI